MRLSEIRAGKQQQSAVIPFWVVSFATFFVTLSVLPGSAQEKGWVLTQKSTTLGDQYVYISPSGLKCVNPKAGFALVTHAPEWNIVLFNDKTRVYYQTTLDKWKQQLNARGLSSDMANKQWTRGSGGNIAGLKATQYVMRGGGTLAHTANGKTKRTTVSSADYWVSDEIQVPPRLADLLAAAYGLPTTSNVPLRLDANDGRSNKCMLDTYRMQSSALPISFFQAPGGYKLVSSDAEVMMNDEQKQMIEDMSKEMGGGLESAPSASTAPRQAAAAPAAAPTGAAADLSKLLDAYKKSQHK